METRYLHMTFFWGRRTEVLFRGWPGARGMLSCRRLTELGRRSPLLGGFFRTAVHALQTGLAYLVMLALMSYNVGVLMVAIGGSAAGFLLFQSLVFWARRPGEVSSTKC
ncbi:unnamed protein product [Spirodela intermedia]|uniref:Copper transport protein n=1 Tax=Spirodela intermedia TaxID=51605 RepID=A0A7I8IBV9_SPIIN|nr:unnamed protein product [Spirodela intermedia]CAA6655060.1 unnamed protein product [Spirodela intermedia]